MKELVERLLRYISIDTQSQHGSQTIPSTEKQKDLGRLLVKELLEMGVKMRERMNLGQVMHAFPPTAEREYRPLALRPIWILRRIFRAAIFIQES